MAKKPNPEVQFRKLGEAMAKLDKQQQLRWTIEFIRQYDEDSLLIGGVLEGMELYLKKLNPPPLTHEVNGALFTTEEVFDMAYGFGGAANLQQALEVLEDQGFQIKAI